MKIHCVTSELDAAAASIGCGIKCWENGHHWESHQLVHQEGTAPLFQFVPIALAHIMHVMWFFYCGLISGNLN